MMTSSNGNIFRVTGHLCGNSPVPGEFLAQRPVTRSFDVFCDLRLNKRLSKHSWGWWFETLSRSLWRHCNECDIDLIPEYLQLQNIRNMYGKGIIINIQFIRGEDIYCFYKNEMKYHPINLALSQHCHENVPSGRWSGINRPTLCIKYTFALAIYRFGFRDVRRWASWSLTWRLRPVNIG